MENEKKQDPTKIWQVKGRFDANQGAVSSDVAEGGKREFDAFGRNQILLLKPDTDFVGGEAFKAEDLLANQLRYNEVSVQGNMFDKYDSDVMHLFNSYKLKHDYTPKVSLNSRSFSHHIFPLH